MKVAIVGGGAAGFFAALSVKAHHPEADVTIFEKSKKLLSKVKISGGGRCNVTNGETDISILSRAYPRGGSKLKKAFYTFNTQHTMDWFEQRGVALTIQDDGCVFPVSQDSQTIIDCFISECKRLEISILTGMGVSRFSPIEDAVQLDFGDGSSDLFDKVIIATGGSPSIKGLRWIEQAGIKIESPVPSLFTFNMPDEDVTSLMGHWGMSGPAILKLSAFGARVLEEKDYQFAVQVNWVNEPNNELVRSQLQNIVVEQSGKQLSNYRPYLLPERLWHFLVQRAGLQLTARWNEIGKKGLNKLINVLTNDIYQVSGKTTFKEEFVTCGGVSLSGINFKTMESRTVPNLYFAGEVMDIDGITGGYNFQAAWTTAYIAGKLC